MSSSLAATAGVGALAVPTHDNGKKQKKLDKYPMLCIQFWAPDGSANSPTLAVAASQLDIYQMLFVQFWAPDDGRRSRLKHV
jgi:hypothetical protein